MSDNADFFESEVKLMKITINGSAKEIAALVLGVQERQPSVTNQLVLSSVDNASGMQDGIFGNPGVTIHDAENLQGTI